MSNSAQYVDPYTGAARYTPAARTTDSTATYSDPFTGILTSNFEGLVSSSLLICVGVGSSAYSTTPTPKPTVAKVLPQVAAIMNLALNLSLHDINFIVCQRTPLLFKQASLAALRQKLTTTNSQLDSATALSPELFERVNIGIQYLQNPTQNIPEQEQQGAITAIIKLVTTWPVELRFPGLDLLRLYAVYQPALLIASISDSDMEAFFRTWANLDELNNTVSGKQVIGKPLETNYMLALRTYANLFGSDAGLQYIKAHQQSIFSLLLADGAWSSFRSKNFRLALATLFLKYGPV